MKVVVTGGLGFVGRALTRRLLARGWLLGQDGREHEIDRLVVFDAVTASDVGVVDPRVELVAGDIRDRDHVFALVDGQDVSVFHLASIVSAHGELDFDLALGVNLDGTRNVLEACRASGGRARVVFASTLAAFGGSAMPETVGDTTKLTPQTTYGTTKAACELLVNDYTRKGFLDGRTPRLPTVIVRPGEPNLAASGFASGVFREALAGRDYVLPVGLETRMPVIGARTVVECLISLHELDGDALGDDRSLNLPSISVTVREMIESLHRVGGTSTLGRVDVRPDPAVERITRTWPLYASAERAQRLGLPHDRDLDQIVREYVEDFLPEEAAADPTRGSGGVS